MPLPRLGSKMKKCFSLLRGSALGYAVSRRILSSFRSPYVQRQLSGDLLSGERLSVDLPSARRESAPREATRVRATAVRREPAQPSRTAEPVSGRTGRHLRSAPDRDQPAGALQALPPSGDDRGPRARPRAHHRGRAAHGHRLSRSRAGRILAARPPSKSLTITYAISASQFVAGSPGGFPRLSHGSP
jgi:hypothetical protein